MRKCVRAKTKRTAGEAVRQKLLKSMIV